MELILMVDRKYFCLAARIVILAAFFIQGIFLMNNMPGDFPKPPRFLFVMMIAIPCVAVFVGFSLQMSRLNPGGNWLKPSWFISPFNRRQPIIFFDFASYLSLAMGAGCFVAGWLHDNPQWQWEFPAFVGFGVLVGVRAVIYFNKNSFFKTGRG
jgi:hypothetical protein